MLRQAAVGSIEIVAAHTARHSHIGALQAAVAASEPPSLRRRAPMSAVDEEEVPPLSKGWIFMGESRFRPVFLICDATAPDPVRDNAAGEALPDRARRAETEL